MSDILTFVEDMALNGYGVAWNCACEKFRPIEVIDSETIIWWHDPEGCDSVDFATAVRATHKNMMERI